MQPQLHYLKGRVIRSASLFLEFGPVFFFFLRFYLGPEEIKIIPFDIIFKFWCFKNTNIYYHNTESFWFLALWEMLFEDVQEQC